MIFVLWSLTILSTVALGFSKDTNISIKLSTVHAERVKDIYAMRGAVLYALNKMAEGGQVPEIELPKNQIGSEEVGEGEPVIAGEPPRDDGMKPEGVTDREAGFSEPQDSDENKEVVMWFPNKEPYSVKIGNINCDVYLSDENGKINLNGINNDNREIFIKFLTKKGMDFPDADVIVDSILDWVDPDDLTHINGAEDGYYGSLPEPYNAKDAPFNSIEELMLVRDVTPEIFDSIRNDITVYGEKQIKLNINFTSKEIISSIPGLSDDLADDLILYIEENGSIKEVDDLREIFWSLGIIGDSFEKIRQYLTLDQSGFVTIRAVAKSSDNKPNEDGKSEMYGYRMIVGKENNEYKIVAVYPE